MTTKESQQLSPEDEYKYRELLELLFLSELDLMSPRPLSQVTNLHTIDKCSGQFCCIHNPSDHALNKAPLQLRGDRWPLMERVCPHGIGHPDPDSVAYIQRVLPGGRESAEYEGIHGCDGCCASTKQA